MAGAAASTPPVARSEVAPSLLPRLAHAVLDRIRLEVPDYAPDANGQIAAEAEFAITEALRCFLRALTTGRRDLAEVDEIFRRLGRLEAEAGRTHDALQAAYRIASQVVMSHLLVWDRTSGAPRTSVVTASAEMFEFIDHLAAMSAEGYAQAHDAGTGGLVSRARLLAMLVRPDPPPMRTVARHAERLGWPVPARACVVEVSSPRQLADAQLGALARAIFGETALGGRLGRRQLMLAPAPLDADAIRARLDHRARGMRLLCGPSVGIGELATSAALVRRASVALRAPVGAGTHTDDADGADPVVLCDEVLLPLALDAAAEPLRLLAVDRLAPLLALSPAKRLKYGRLLSAWLEFGSLHGSAPGVLDKHRQTLRYQQVQLERMFGNRLHDRTARVELMLALRAVLPTWEDELRMFIPPV